MKHVGNTSYLIERANRDYRKRTHTFVFPLAQNCFVCSDSLAFFRAAIYYVSKFNSASVWLKLCVYISDQISHQTDEKSKEASHEVSIEFLHSSFLNELFSLSRMTLEIHWCENSFELCGIIFNVTHMLWFLIFHQQYKRVIFVYS